QASLPGRAPRSRRARHYGGSRRPDHPRRTTLAPHRARRRHRRRERALRGVSSVPGRSPQAEERAQPHAVLLPLQEGPGVRMSAAAVAPRQERSRKTLDRLLDAAERLILEGGAEAATVPAIV